MKRPAGLVIITTFNSNLHLLLYVLIDIGELLFVF